MFKIISTKEYKKLMVESKMYCQLVEKALDKKAELPILNCGYKNCQFTTTDAKGLKIHRARVHRKK